MNLEERAKRKAKKWLKTIDEVQGVAVGEKVVGGQSTGRLAIVVFVNKKKPVAECAVIVPEMIKGVETDVVETGEFNALKTASAFASQPPSGSLPTPVFLTLPEAAASTDVADHRKRHRPVCCGISIAHKDVTAGTLGSWVRDSDGNIRGLSNAHVLANTNRGKLGDCILQPGPYDGGKVSKEYVVGTLHKTIPIRMNKRLGLFCRIARFFGYGSAQNFVDAALFIPTVPIDFRYLNGPALPIEWRDAIPGDKVFKIGRTTGYTEGKCLYVGATVTVNYGSEGTATFNDLDIFDVQSAGGDSGSSFCGREGEPVFSLLFAGSTTHTLGCARRNVKALLGVDVI